MVDDEIRFMNLPEEYSRENAFFGLLPIAYEKSATYGFGASKGPKRILEASKHLEYYDEQFDNEPFEKGIFQEELLALNSETPEQAIAKIKEAVKNNKNNFLVSLGGDHAVTIGLVQGFEEKLKEKNEDFSILVLDAHSDFRYSWNNSLLNHACVTRRLVDKHKIGVIGVRSQDKDEAFAIDENNNIKIIKSYDFSQEKFNELLRFLGKKIYLSIDVDFFDPSFIRNTGTPEPGGFQWNETIGLLRRLFQEKEVIAADIVEFSPKDNSGEESQAEAEAFSLAKLAYKLMALKLFQQSN